MECSGVEAGWRKGSQFACGGGECGLQINDTALEQSLLLLLDYFSQGQALALLRTPVLVSAPCFLQHLCCLLFLYYLSTFLSHLKAECWIVELLSLQYATGCDNGSLWPIQIPTSCTSCK